MLKSLTYLFALLAGVALLIFTVNLFTETTPSKQYKNFDKELRYVSDKLNASLPKNIDPQTRLDHTNNLPGNKFVYYLTILNYSAEEMDIPTLKLNLANNLKQNYAEVKAMEIFRQNNVTLIYKYRDKDGRTLVEITLDPSMFY